MAPTKRGRKIIQQWLSGPLEVRAQVSSLRSAGQRQDAGINAGRGQQSSSTRACRILVHLTLKGTNIVVCLRFLTKISYQCSSNGCQTNLVLAKKILGHRNDVGNLSPLCAITHWGSDMKYVTLSISVHGVLQMTLIPSTSHLTPSCTWIKVDTSATHQVAIRLRSTKHTTGTFTLPSCPGNGSGTRTWSAQRHAWGPPWS